MALQNRVTPEGEIVATPARGTLMGNRGRLHGADRTLGTSRWATKAWIACALSFRGRTRSVMAPGSYTELFFLDEATAYAAGHRPCAECRYRDWSHFRDLWGDLHGPAKAAGIDAILHAARTTRDRRKVTWSARAEDLPDGAFLRGPDGPLLLWRGTARPWSAEGYGAARPRPAGDVAVLTPAPVVALLAAGLPVAVHGSAA